MTDSYRTVKVIVRLQHVMIQGYNDVIVPQEVPMPPVTELQCHERLQIRVPKRSSESDESERSFFSLHHCDCTSNSGAAVVPYLNGGRTKMLGPSPTPGLVVLMNGIVHDGGTGSGDYDTLA
ncbi:hypothetical protein JHK82_043134 [Glycine max]|nr:hypothetical protein JHK82_043134 [Glycine max]